MGNEPVPANMALLDTEDNWETDLGGVVVDDGRVFYRGRDLFGELSEGPWLRLYLYGTTGRLFSLKEIKLLEGLWSIGISYPDPRIWCNRVAALAGTVRSTASLALSASLAVAEAEIYGNRANVGAIDFIRRACEAVEAGEELEQLLRREMKRYRVVFGYGRPVRSVDERIEPALALARRLGLAGGKHLALAKEVEGIMIKRWRQRMNITGLAAALFADLRFSAREYACYVAPGFAAGSMPCYADARQKTEGHFFPLRCERIAYQGVAPRSWHEPC